MKQIKQTFRRYFFEQYLHLQNPMSQQISLIKGDAQLKASPKKQSQLQEIPHPQSNGSAFSQQYPVMYSKAHPPMYAIPVQMRQNNLNQYSNYQPQFQTLGYAPQLMIRNQQVENKNSNSRPIIIDDSDDEKVIQVPPPQQYQMVYQQYPNNQIQQYQPYMNMVYQIPPQAVYQNHQSQYTMNFHHHQQITDKQQYTEDQSQINKNQKKIKQKDLKSLKLTSKDIKSQMYQQLDGDVKKNLPLRRTLDLDYMEKQGLIYEPDKFVKRSKVQPRAYSPEQMILPQKKPRIQKGFKSKQSIVVKSEQIVPIQSEKTKQKRIGTDFQATIPEFQLQVKAKFIKKYDKNRVSQQQFSQLVSELTKFYAFSNDEDLACIIVQCQYDLEKASLHIREHGKALAYYLESQRMTQIADSKDDLHKKKLNQ